MLYKPINSDGCVFAPKIEVYLKNNITYIMLGKIWSNNHVKLIFGWLRENGLFFLKGTSYD